MATMATLSAGKMVYNQMLNQDAESRCFYYFIPCNNKIMDQNPWIKTYFDDGVILISKEKSTPTTTYFVYAYYGTPEICCAEYIASDPRVLLQNDPFITWSYICGDVWHHLIKIAHKNSNANETKNKLHIDELLSYIVCGFSKVYIKLHDNRDTDIVCKSNIEGFVSLATLEIVNNFNLLDRIPKIFDNECMKSFYESMMHISMKTICVNIRRKAHNWAMSFRVPEKVSIV
jgi:hypothetical protein